MLKEPKDLFEMDKAIKLHERLTNEVTIKESEFPLITDQMTILDKYNVGIENEIRTMEKKIPVEWAKYLEVLSEAEKMLGYSKVLAEKNSKNN